MMMMNDDADSTPLLGNNNNNNSNSNNNNSNRLGTPSDNLLFVGCRPGLSFSPQPIFAVAIPPSIPKCRLCHDKQRNKKIEKASGALTSFE